MFDSTAEMCEQSEQRMSRTVYFTCFDADVSVISFVDTLVTAVGQEKVEFVCGTRMGDIRCFVASLTTDAALQEVVGMNGQITGPGGHCFVQIDPGEKIVTVHMTTVHSRITNPELLEELSQYGRVLHIDRQYYRQYLNILNGEVTVLLCSMEGDIPRRMKIAGWDIHVEYKGQPYACHNCFRFGHTARKCPIVLCWACKATGHMSKDCKGLAVSSDANVSGDSIGSTQSTETTQQQQDRDHTGCEESTEQQAGTQAEPSTVSENQAVLTGTRKDSGVGSDEETTCASPEGQDHCSEYRVVEQLMKTAGEVPVIKEIIDRVTRQNVETSSPVRHVVGVDGYRKSRDMLSFVFLKDTVLFLELDRRKDTFYYVQQWRLSDCAWVKRLKFLHASGARVVQPSRTSRAFDVATQAAAAFSKDI